jgi:cytoskeletal protein RodZ
MSQEDATDDPASPDLALQGSGLAAPRGLSVGAMLADARAARGLELVTIAQETRVPLRHLMAIEADQADALPALPYAIGFVKSYARAVGLDADAIAAQFRAESRIAPPVPTAVRLEPIDEARLPPRFAAWGAGAALLLLLIGLGSYGAGLFDGPPPAASTAADEVLPPPAGAGVQGPPADAALAPPATPVTGPAALPATTPPDAVPAAAPLPASGSVVLTAREDVWVKIYERGTGRRAFMGVLAAGQRFDVPADGPPLTLRAGKAGAVAVTVGGRALPPLGGPVQTIDGVVLTAAALAERFAPPIAAPAQPAARAPVQPPASPAAPQQGMASPAGE